MNYTEYRKILEKHLKEKKITQKEFDQQMNWIDIIEWV